MVERGDWLKVSTDQLERRLEFVGDELQELNDEYDARHSFMDEDDLDSYRHEGELLMDVRKAIREELARRENADN